MSYQELKDLAIVVGEVDAIGNILRMAEWFRFNDSTILIWQERSDQLELEMLQRGML